MYRLHADELRLLRRRRVNVIGWASLAVLVAMVALAIFVLVTEE